MRKYTSTQPLYLDYNATCPVDPRVFSQMSPWFTEHFGNPSSSLHAYGWRASEAVKLAREQTASLIGSELQEVYFTSGATEALNLAIKGIYESSGSARKQFISFRTEHKAVLDSLGYLEKKGVDVLYLDVDADGMPDINMLKSSVGPQTLAVVAMLANNETGLISPITEIAEITHAAGAVLICDATQACGKIPVQVNEIGADLLTLSAHKMYGPKGTGALFIRRKNPRIRLLAQIHGGGHENGIRSGTLNVPGIVGLGAAAELATEWIAAYNQVQRVKLGLEQKLEQLGARIQARNAPRLPNTINLRFPGIDSARLITALPELALSTGSACSSSLNEPSHVLRAMGLSTESCRESIRISLGKEANLEETQYISEKFLNALEKLQA